MKLDQQITDVIEDCDAVFIIAVKGNNHYTSIMGKDTTNPEQTVHHLVQGMLGAVHTGIKGGTGNALPLMILIQEAQKRFPKLNINSKP